MSNKMKRNIILTVIILIVIVCVAIVLINSQKGQVKSIADINSITDSSKTGTSNYSNSGINSQSVAPETSTYDKQDTTKVIKTSNISMQSDDYTNCLNKINNLIDSTGAMVVKMQETQGNNYVTYAQDSKLRNVSMIIKVANDKFASFNNELKQYGNVTSYYEEVKDISSTYADIEAKITSYKLQEAQLNDLLKKATAAKDLLEISNQIQSVIQQRESLQRQKNSYDNQIEYSTVTLNLSEVQSTVIKEKNLFSRMGDTFKSSLSDLKTFTIEKIIVIVYLIPYLVIIAIVVIVILLIIKASNKKNKVNKK